MFSPLLLNFCLLISTSYLLSLTYKRSTEFTAPIVNWSRISLISMMGLVLMLFPAHTGPGVIIDLRIVPIVYLTFQLGWGFGLLSVVPLLLFRFWLGGVGVWPAILGAMCVVLLAGMFRSQVSLFASEAHSPAMFWKLLLTFLPNGFFLPIFLGSPALYFSVWLPLVAMSYLSFLSVLGILRHRYQALALAEAFEQQAYQDGLTNLPNRRMLKRDIETLSTKNAICLIDVDNFKRINDTYGHIAGDEVLREVGQILEASVQPPDRIYRYGGEEFVILSGLMDATDLRQFGDRLRRQVAQARFPVLGDQGVTISIGLAQCQTSSAKTYFQRADDALYIAKAEGRNRVVVWTPEINRLTASHMA